MCMTYESMKAQFLPASLVCNNFVEGIEPYSYEDYLLEFVNESELFRSKSGGEAYSHPQGEAKGECDCVSRQYQIDFKLVASKTALQSKRLFSHQIHVSNGITCFCASKMRADDKDYKPICATILYAALRPMMQESFDLARQNKTKQNGIENDIATYIKCIETDKNLLLFFPYNLFFDENDDLDLGLKLAIQGLNQDFRESLLYRKERLPNRDTYFAFLYAHNLIFLKWNDTELAFVERLPIEKSPLFMKLLGYCDAFDGGILK